MADDFKYDVFLSHSEKDKVIVRPIAERLRADGLRVWLDDWEIRPGDSTPAKIEEGLEHSRVLILCMSANAFGSDWAQLEAGTFRFRDPLNKERRFIPLRLDAAPLNGSLAQSLYNNWLAADRELEYMKLLEICWPAEKSRLANEDSACERFESESIQLLAGAQFLAYAFNPDGRSLLTGDGDRVARLWNLKTGRCLRLLEGHTGRVLSVAWGPINAAPSPVRMTRPYDYGTWRRSVVCACW